MTGLPRYVEAAVRRWYNGAVRDRLPRKLGLYNGVVARQPRLFDATDHLPDYKATLLAHVREAVDAGETVVVVGGGKGIASVVAARAAGETGHVVTYEASESQAEICRETMALNGVADRTSVETALVGPAKGVYGDDVGERVAPADLPPHDALVMDCEGAELAILPALGALDDERAPETVVVETHPEYGATLPAVRERLREAGYEPVTADEATWAEAGGGEWVCTAVASREERDASSAGREATVTD